MTTTLTAFQNQKFNALFDQLDANHNGMLGFDDFSAHARHIKDAKGWGESHPDFERLIAAKHEFWKELHARAGAKTDAVSRDEWLAFWGKVAGEVRTTGAVPAWITRIHYVLLKSLDLDGDGKVSHEEYALYLKSIGSNADAKAAFERMDANKNGLLDLEELEDLLSQWILSDNPSDPGNTFLLGQ